MEKLYIKGTIASTEDSSIPKGEETFGLQDLENFLDSREGTGPFLVVIDSPGGSVDEGFKIYNRLKSEGAHTLAIRANSIASIIFLAGVTRSVLPDTEMIIHNAWVDPGDLTGEKLNYYSAKMLVDYFAETDAKILSIYTEFAGEEKASELLAFMAVDKNLGAEKALTLGLATRLSKEEEIPAQNLARKVLTYSKNFIELINQTKTEEMKTEEKLGAFEKVLKGFARAFKINAKNMIVTTSEGVELFVTGEGGQLVGSTAYIAEDGLPTEAVAPAGEHTLSDGTKIVVDEAGVIVEAEVAEAPEEIVAKYEEQKAAMEEEKKAMEEKKKAMEEEKKELEAKLLAEKEEKEEVKAQFANLQAEFLNLKNEVLGDPENKKSQVLSKEEFAKLTPGQKIRLAAMNKATN